MYIGAIDSLSVDWRRLGRDCHGFGVVIIQLPAV